MRVGLALAAANRGAHVVAAVCGAIALGREGEAGVWGRLARPETPSTRSDWQGLVD